jgi:hypothetical protein
VGEHTPVFVGTREPGVLPFGPPVALSEPTVIVVVWAKDWPLYRAAPDLLAALELIQQTHSHPGPCHGRQCDAMNAAIAKAKGEA